MRSAAKTVYYCDFCLRHRLVRSAIEQHERVCTLNPQRVCRWQFAGDDHPEVDLAALVSRLKEHVPFRSEDIDWLRDETEGCPPCMLAALRQSGNQNFHYDERSQRIFDYDDEVKRYREAERAEAQEQEYHGAVNW